MNSYLKHWGVDTAVFLRTVWPREVFISTGLRRDLERLQLLCLSEPGKTGLLIGEAGSGKTTILRWLVEELPPNTHESMLIMPVGREEGPGWLTPQIAGLLGPLAEDDDPSRLMMHVAEYIDQLMDQKRRLVILVDAAHLAQTEDALGEILTLLNLESLSRGCLSFILAGEPSLIVAIQKVPGLAAKVAMQLTLHSLSEEDTAAYIRHRTALAGLPCPFEDQTIQEIHQRSEGLYARIDVYAEHCLIEAFQRQKRIVSLDVALAASQHLPTPPPPYPRDPGLSPHAQRTPSKTEAMEKTLPLQSPAKGTRETSVPKTKSEPNVVPAVPRPLDPSKDLGGAPPSESGFASITLSSLFKSGSGRQKPKRP